MTLGPTFLSSSLYLNLGRVQDLYGTRFAHISPRAYPFIFIFGDFICIALIGCGGSLAAIFADNPIGVDLMVGGLGAQVLFTAIFGIMFVIIYRRSISKRVHGQKFIIGKWLHYGPEDA